MTKTYQVESEDDFFSRMKTLARKIDKGEFVGSYESESFETVEDMQTAVERDRKAGREEERDALLSQRFTWFRGKRGIRFCQVLNQKGDTLVAGVSYKDGLRAPMSAIKAAKAGKIKKRS